jgi:hypothetical protein
MRGSDTTRSGEAAAVDTIAGCRIIADEFLFHDHSSACSTDYKGAIDRYKSDKFYQVTTLAEYVQTPLQKQPSKSKQAHRQTGGHYLSLIRIQNGNETICVDISPNTHYRTRIGINQVTKHSTVYTYFATARTDTYAYTVHVRKRACAQHTGENGEENSLL